MAFELDSKPFVKNVVLVHGAWMNGSCWEGVYKILTSMGHDVSVVANPETSLADDVAALQRVLDRQDGEVILAAHSYGGAIITQGGHHPKVAALVYIAAFMPDEGETVMSLLPGAGGALPVEMTPDGFAFLKRAVILASFVPDFSEEEAKFLADAQVPISIPKAGSAPITAPAWRVKPSWYLVSSQDRIIAPDTERMMAKRAGATVAEVDGGHLAFVSRPEIAARMIRAAAEAIAGR